MNDNSITPIRNSGGSFLNIILFFGLIILLIWVVFSYFLVENRTRLHSGKIEDLDQICTQENTKARFIKVLEYKRLKKFAKVYCGYNDSSLNRVLVLNYTIKWEVIFDNKINKDGKISWPIYI
jgi:hypothetical protein